MLALLGAREAGEAEWVSLAAVPRVRKGSSRSKEMNDASSKPAFFLLCGHQQANLKDSRQGESRLGSEAEGLWVVQRNRPTMPLLYALVASTSSPPTILAEHAGKKGNYTDYTTRILGELAGCRGVVFSWSCVADSKLTPLAVIIMS